MAKVKGIGGLVVGDDDGIGVVEFELAGDSIREGGLNSLDMDGGNGSIV